MASVTPENTSENKLTKPELPHCIEQLPESSNRASAIAHPDPKELDGENSLTKELTKELTYQPVNKAFITQNVLCSQTDEQKHRYYKQLMNLNRDGLVNSDKLAKTLNKIIKPKINKKTKGVT